MKTWLTGIQVNLLANFTGSVIQAVLGIVYLPIFANLLGMESYGLIGVYLTLQAVTSGLVQGIQATISREVAYQSGHADGAGEVGGLLSRLEGIAWGAVVVFSAGFALAAPWLADHWIQTRILTPTEALYCLILCGFTVSQQWPAAVYLGALHGMQRQVSVNTLQLACNVGRFPLTHLILWLGSPSLTTFFVMQALAFLLQNLGAGLLWRIFRQDSSHEANQTLNWTGFARSALSISYLTWLALVLGNADKVFLSTFLPLEEFGQYSLVAILAAGLALLGGPIQQAIYPRLAQLVAAKADLAWRQLYHDACQLLGAVQIPVIITLEVFAGAVLVVWTDQPDLALRQAGTLRWLVGAWSLLWILSTPGNLLIALNRTRVLLAVHFLGVIVYLPLLWVMGRQFGAEGVAAALFGAAVIMFMLLVPWTHKTLFAGSFFSWLDQAIIRPALVSLVVALGFYFVGAPTDRWALAFFLIAALALSYLITFSVTPVTRDWLRARLGQWLRLS